VGRVKSGACPRGHVVMPVFLERSCCWFTVSSGSNVTITCSKAPNATWPATGFVVNVTASATGAPGCTAARVVQTTVTVATPATVTLVGHDSPSLNTMCPNEALRTFNFSLYTSPEGVGLSDVGVSSSGPACAASPTTGKQGEANQTVCCSVNIAAWGLHNGGCTRFRMRDNNRGRHTISHHSPWKKYSESCGAEHTTYVTAYDGVCTECRCRPAVNRHMSEWCLCRSNQGGLRA
jgi:hypothetical protein